MSQPVELVYTTVLPGPLYICSFAVPSLPGEPCMTVEAECPNRGEIVDILHAEWLERSGAEPAMDALSYVTRNLGAFVAEIRAVAATIFEGHEISGSEHPKTWEEVIGADTTRVLDCGQVIDLATMEVVLDKLSGGLLYALCTLTIDNERRSFDVVSEFRDVLVPVRLLTSHWWRKDRPFMSFDANRVVFGIEQELTARIGIELRAACTRAV